MSAVFNKIKSLTAIMLVTLFTLSFILVSVSSAIAQDTAKTEAKADTAVNKTMKSVFSAAKKIAKKDDGNLFSILMITAVVIVVIFAIWLSFRPDEEDRYLAKKRKKAEADAAAASSSTTPTA